MRGRLRQVPQRGNAVAAGGARGPAVVRHRHAPHRCRRAAIRARGLHWAELAVEECNPQARALYERLGYIAYGREPASRDEEAADGSIIRYETACTLMRKELP